MDSNELFLDIYHWIDIGWLFDNLGSFRRIESVDTENKYKNVRKRPYYYDFSRVSDCSHEKGVVDKIGDCFKKGVSL